MRVFKAGVVGATGYTGVELLRLLSRHPQVEIAYIISRSAAGQAVSEIFPSLRGVCDVVFHAMSDDSMVAMADVCDVVFFATPHGVAMTYAPMLIAKGVKVIDLGADFRLKSLEDFEQWYGMAHSCPQILADAVYGLPEISRNAIATAQVIANPGCYPTTAILGLKPIIDVQNASDAPLIDKRIIIDAKSGVSGAGRNARLNLLLSELSENFSAYGVSGHRHQPEIEQGVHELLGSHVTHNIRFVPHLLPMIRGMFSTIHLALTDVGMVLDWQAIFERTYGDEYFIDVLPAGVLPDTRAVRASNRLRIGVHQDNSAQSLTVLVVQDNLVKGAAGQAVQNMNIMFALPETLGLEDVPVVP